MIRRACHPIPGLELELHDIAHAGLTSTEHRLEPRRRKHVLAARH
jgi:hypothetical protein